MLPSPTLDLLTVHGIGARKVVKLVVDLVEVGVGPTLVLSSVHGMDAIKYYYCIVSFTNPLAAVSFSSEAGNLSHHVYTLKH